MFKIDQFKESYDKLNQFEYYLFSKNIGKTFFIIGLMNTVFFFVYLIINIFKVDELFHVIYPHLPTIRALFSILIFLYLLLVVINIKRTSIENGNVILIKTIIGPILVIFGFLFGFIGDFLLVSIIGDIIGNFDYLAFYIYSLIILVIGYLLSINYFNNEDHSKFLKLIVFIIVLAFLAVVLGFLLGIQNPLTSADPFEFLRSIRTYYAYYYANAILNGFIVLLFGWYLFQQSREYLREKNDG